MCAGSTGSMQPPSVFVDQVITHHFSLIFMFSADLDLLDCQGWCRKGTRTILCRQSLPRELWVLQFHYYKYKQEYKTKPLSSSQILFMAHAGDSACFKVLTVTFSSSSTVIIMSSSCAHKHEDRQSCTQSSPTQSEPSSGPPVILV